MARTRVGLGGSASAYAAFQPKSAAEITVASPDITVRVTADDVVVRVPPEMAVRVPADQVVTRP